MHTSAYFAYEVITELTERFLNTDRGPDVRVTSQFSVGKITSSWLVRATDWLVLFLNHLSYCVDRALLP